MNNSWENRDFYRYKKGRQRHSRIKSLKLWLPLFFIVVVVVYFAEQNYPIEIHQSVPYSGYALSLFALFVGVLTSYRLFERCDINTRSDRGLFGMKLLSLGIGGAGLSLLIFGYLLYFEGLFIGSSISRDTVSFFAIFLGFALLIVAAYLVFKFERRSGIIVYNR